MPGIYTWQKYGRNFPGLNIEGVTTFETQKNIFKYLLMSHFITKQNKSGAE